MTRAEAIQQQIDEAMDEFDFRKVAEHMKSVNWKWGTGIPDEFELRQCVRALLREVSEKGGSISTGGFHVDCVENKENRWIRFNIYFTIEHVTQDGISYL